MIRLKRIYEPAARDDGERFLVERLWPRGIGKGSARIADWLKDLAPSPALRTWYGHDPAKWTEFRKRYRAELRDPARQALLRDLAARARRGRVTFVFAARDMERNSARVLKDVVERPARRPLSRKPLGRGRVA